MNKVFLLYFDVSFKKKRNRWEETFRSTLYIETQAEELHFFRSNARDNSTLDLERCSISIESKSEPVTYANSVN